MKGKSKPVDMKRDNKTGVLKIIELLEKEHPDAKIALNCTNSLGFRQPLLDSLRLLVE